MLTRLFYRFSSVLYSPRYLLVTNTATGVLFFGIGDVLVQKLIEHRPEFDQKRFRNSCVAGTYMGFVSHFWYGFLDQVFPGRTRSLITKKLLCEAVIGPPFAGSIFFVVGVLNARPLHTIMDDIRDNFRYLIMADWCFYIPLQYFNFQYLSPKFRVLYVSMLSLIYDSVLVYILYRNDIKRNQEKTGKKFKPI